MLTFDFGVKSLLQICIDKIEQCCFPESVSNDLPLNLKNILINRKDFSPGTLYESTRPLIEKPKLFPKSVIHAGL